jgi:hypothetical protein
MKEHTQNRMKQFRIDIERIVREHGTTVLRNDFDLLGTDDVKRVVADFSAAYFRSGDAEAAYKVIAAGEKATSWYSDDLKVSVVTAADGIRFFDNLDAAREVYPDLDPRSNGERFTWAMRDELNGETIMRFEDWATEERMSR